MMTAKNYNYDIGKLRWTGVGVGWRGMIRDVGGSASGGGREAAPLSASGASMYLCGVGMGWTCDSRTMR